MEMRVNNLAAWLLKGVRLPLICLSRHLQCCPRCDFCLHSAVSLAPATHQCHHLSFHSIRVVASQTVASLFTSAVG